MTKEDELECDKKWERFNPDNPEYGDYNSFKCGFQTALDYIRSRPSYCVYSMQGKWYDYPTKQIQTCEIGKALREQPHTCDERCIRVVEVE